MFQAVSVAPAVQLKFADVVVIREAAIELAAGAKQDGGVLTAKLSIKKSKSPLALVSSNANKANLTVALVTAETSIVTLSPTFDGIFVASHV